MLAFDASFVSGGAEDVLGCMLWADEPKFGRVRFHIGNRILVDMLHGGNPVHHDENVKLCETCRPRIKKACRRAFYSRAKRSCGVVVNRFQIDRAAFLLAAGGSYE
jgi:hypothetical protein